MPFNFKLFRNKKKICFIAGCLGKGGAERQLLQCKIFKQNEFRGINLIYEGRILGKKDK